MDTKRGSQPDTDRSGEGLLARLADERVLVWLALLQAQHRVITALERRLAEEVGIPLAFAEVLVQLEKAPGQRLQMQQLARSVYLSKSGVSRLVGRMEAAGLVVREGDPANLRVTYAAITARGHEFFLRAAPVSLGGVERYFSSRISLEEAAILQRVLDRIIDAPDDEPVNAEE